MSLDRSLKGKSTLERHRNVLRRSERVAFLEDAEKWSEDKKASVFGLVKVAHRKQVAAKKVKTEAVAGAVATPVAAAGGKAAAPAAGVAAKPAAGAKAAAAPAAKPAAKK